MNLEKSVALSLAEDVGDGDITAALIPAEKQGHASVISREQAVIVGQPWFEAVYQQLDPQVKIEWLIEEGEMITPDQSIAKLEGSARSLLTGERCALNWLQTLSGVATLTQAYVDKLQGTQAQLLDTRKTLPGLRQAQKYAVAKAGGKNHRMGLYDAFLIKENHIMGCGSIAIAIEIARTQHPDKTVEVEVESLGELKEALEAQADIIMLDNFSLQDMAAAVAMNAGQAKLEVSGNVSLETIAEIAKTGVDYISVGALTKNVRAVDLSMRLI